MTGARPRDWAQYWGLYYLWTGSYQWGTERWNDGHRHTRRNRFFLCSRAR